MIASCHPFATCTYATTLTNSTKFDGEYKIPSPHFMAEIARAVSGSSIQELVLRDIHSCFIVAPLVGAMAHHPTLLKSSRWIMWTGGRPGQCATYWTATLRNSSRSNRSSACSPRKTFVVISQGLITNRTVRRLNIHGCGIHDTTLLLPTLRGSNNTTLTHME